MKNSYRRAFCASLALVLVPGIAAAEAPDSSYAGKFPAIATGLAIPSAPRATAASANVAAVRGRSVLIDAASATLYMMEGNQIVDSMRVIVGKPEAATPELKTSITYATLNPYWHVPRDIASTLTAPNVLKHGVSYLEERGYEVMSDFGPTGQVLDPTTVDWQAVADGRAEVLVRQRPGPANSMGQMKFSLDYAGGIYLHDTPMKDLFDQDNRSLSAGCVRLEDAPRLAQWLLGGEPLEVASTAPEQMVRLPRQVPVTITYLDSRAQMQLAALR